MVVVMVVVVVITVVNSESFRNPLMGDVIGERRISKRNVYETVFYQ